MARHPQFGNVITEKKRGVSNFELQWNTVLKIVNQSGNVITEKKWQVATDNRRSIILRTSMAHGSSL